MTERLHLSSRHRTVLVSLLQEHLPGVEVWAYGSRVNGRSHDGSDLDLVLRGPGLTEIPTGQLADFEEAVGESNIPFLVEARDWARLPERFHGEIERNYVVLDAGKPDTTHIVEGAGGAARPQLPQTCGTLGMAGEWRERPLGEITQNYDTLRVPVKQTDRRPGPYPYYGASGIVDYVDKFIFDGEYLLIAEDGENLRTRKTPIAFLARGRFWVNNHAHIVVGNTESDTRFLLYALSQTNISGFLTGSAMPKLTQGNLSRIPLPTPPLPEQRAIAHILGALDDKTEMNRRMNATLEAMARTLFKDWFVDFGPTRAKMAGRKPYLAPEIWKLFPDRLNDEGKPEGWVQRSVYDFANVVYGAPFASKQFNTDGVGMPLIRIRDLATHEPSVFTEEVHPKGHVIQPGDIVVGMDGEFRLHIWKGPLAWLNQRVCHFEPLNEVPAAFLTEALKSPLEFFERGKVGTTVIHLGKGDIDTFRLLYPGDDLLAALSYVAGPLIEAMTRNALESRTLAQIRDVLLPKLMSGEIRVNDVEKRVGEVA